MYEGIKNVNEYNFVFDIVELVRIIYLFFRLVEY